MEPGTAASPTSSQQSSPRFTFRGAETECDNFNPMAQGDEVRLHDETLVGQNRFWHRQGEGDQPEVLDPDHPLMKRFQDALKAHLERQVHRLNEEVQEMEAIIKKLQLEREELGISLYDMQQEVAKQQAVIDDYHDTLNNLSKLRQEMETQVEASRNVYKTEQLKLINAQKKEMELRHELEGLVNLERQFADWEKQMESELAVSERITEKTKVEKKQLTAEMQKQDIFILKLLNEISNLEAKLVTYQGQFELKEAERAKVSQAVADANADLEALRWEQHRLVQSWNSVIISISQRDKVYAKLMVDYNKIEEQFRNMKNDIEGLKRESKEEMLKNERLTVILNRVQAEEANIERLTSIEEEKKNALEIQLSSLQHMIEETDKEITTVTIAYHKLQHEDKLLQNEIEKLSTEKLELEEKIIEKLQDQITQDKAAKYLNRLLRTLRSKTKDQEVIMVNTENQLTRTGLEAESQKGANDQTQIILDEKKKQLEMKEKQLDNLELELSHCMSALGKKQVHLDLLNKKLEQLSSRNGQDSMSPLELKIISLEGNIAETCTKSVQLQQFWIRQQRHLVELANQRNEQLHNINLMRKQVMIMSQKNLKIEQEFDHQNTEEQRLTRSISSLVNKLLSLNLKLWERKDYKENLDKENLYTQNKYLNILKDAEMDGVRLQSEIQELEQEKVQLGETLLEKQRDYLAWEKQFLMARETKQNTDRERSKEGEVGNMKAEIHRMEVRYSQLRKAQEKLIGDLESCVARRDAMVDQTEARERKTYKGGHRTRYNFQKNLEALRAKIKQFNSEIKSQEHQIADVQRRKEELIEQMKSKEDQVQQLQDNIKQLDVQVEEGQLQRYKNLEVLVRRQRKARMYGDVKGRRHRIAFRSENALDMELQKQRTMNAELISIVESLFNDFPCLKYPLTKVLNTLRLEPA